MKSKITTFLTLTLVAVILAALIPTTTVSADTLAGRGGPGSGSSQGTGVTGQGMGTGMGAGLGLTPLTASEAAGLQSAILEEYSALNLYNAVMAQFGSVIPFSQIALSEQTHINTLVRQAQKYGLDVPANPGLATIPTFISLESACQAGVTAEIADAALYDELISLTTHTDLLRVYQNLQSASLDKHLPEFEACN
ncbi:MAG: hypothetical protein JW704_05170 [Anaerolineaceae bacterium]|nr:hypothetical protein [Anaerolineaceae bacterium]MBN2677509.1 hypothetical protein [Anaerolineaceae bacterium]